MKPCRGSSDYRIAQELMAQAIDLLIDFDLFDATLRDIITVADTIREIGIEKTRKLLLIGAAIFEDEE